MQDTKERIFFTGTLGITNDDYIKWANKHVPCDADPGQGGQKEWLCFIKSQVLMMSGMEILHLLQPPPESIHGSCAINLALGHMLDSH